MSVNRPAGKVGTEICTIRGDTLALQGGASVRFEYPIAQIAEFPEAIVVLVRSPADVIYNRNVFGISRGGQVLWQVPQYEWVKATALTRRSSGRMT